MRKIFAAILLVVLTIAAVSRSPFIGETAATASMPFCGRGASIWVSIGALDSPPHPEHALRPRA